MKNTCAFCLQEKSLRKSHIIPKFVYNHLKKTSVTGYMRTTQNINKRVQDGLKGNMLCDECEGLFSEWENYFCRDIFKPLMATDTDRKGNIKYNEKFLLFCVSICWRYLTFSLRSGHRDDFSPSILKEVEKALTTWKDFLLGIRSSPEKYELYFYDFGGQVIQGIVPINWHRYLQRSIDQMIWNKGNICIVYVKLLSFIIVGYAAPLEKSSWLRDKRISVKQGMLTYGRYNFPEELRNLMFEKSDKVNFNNSSLSPKQQKIIKNAYSKNMSNFANSDMFLAFKRDFGIPD